MQLVQQHPEPGGAGDRAAQMGEDRVPPDLRPSTPVLPRFCRRAQNVPVQPGVHIRAPPEQPGPLEARPVRPPRQRLPGRPGLRHVLLQRGGEGGEAGGGGGGRTAGAL